MIDVVVRKMSITVRQIELKDAKGFYKALSSVAAEKKYILTLEPPSFESTQTFIRSNIENNHAQYVAESNETIVGWADIIPFTRQSMTHVGSLGIGVISEFRGQGIGRRLLEITIEHAWQQGLKRLELEVFSDNEIAMNLYKKYGYQVEGIKRYARCLNGDYQDIVVMAQYRI